MGIFAEKVFYMKGIRPCRRRKAMKFAKYQKTLEKRNKRSKPKKTRKTNNNNTSLYPQTKVGKPLLAKPKISSKGNMAYTNFQMQRVVGFKDIYPEQGTPPSIISLLDQIPREKIIQVAQVLINEYKNARFEDMQKFFSPDNKALKDDFNQRFVKFKEPYISYNFCTLQTPVELLKYAYSIPYSREKNVGDKVEENLLKAILIINEGLMEYTYSSTTQDSMEKVAELMVVNSFSQKDINNFNLNDVFRETLTKSIDLFEYVSTDEYFKPIYGEFLKKLGINNHNEYIKSILGVFAIIKDKGAGTFIYDPKQDLDNLIKPTVLDYISMPINRDISLEQNEDYRMFRDKPLIKLQDGSYEIVNVGFLLERLFSSLYFDFKSIAGELRMNGFEDQYKQSFMEKTLLCKYLKDINQNAQYTAMSSNDSCAIKRKGDDGEPDYYMKSNKTGNIILFENKDIMINGSIKESRNFKKVIAEYKNKLLLKTYNNKGYIETPKPEGIGQLIEQINKIQTNNAFWDKVAPTNSLIYPVLVVGDSKLLPDGMSYLMQKWYEGRCKSEKVNLGTLRPLIVLSISTLLLYADEFTKNGFEYYFEKYYKSIDNAKKQQHDPYLACSNLSVSFSEYMKKVYPKGFVGVFNSYKKKIFAYPNHNNNKKL